MTISMNDLELMPALADAVTDMGYTEPTPIQVKAIPVALAGRDLIACAATGTGKTAAFLLPLLQRLNDGETTTRCRALIISPTRELALQIDEQALALGYHVGLSAVAVVGGVNMAPQERALREGSAMVVATPGRLLDHMRYGYVDLAGVEVLVLDEADRMLDMGFLPDIQRILAALPAGRQTLLFSATMSTTIRQLADTILRDPVTVTVDRQAPAIGIEQSVCAVAQDRKAALLSTLLRRAEMTSVIVFVRRKIDADQLARSVRRGGIEATSIHADRSQEERIAALEGFRRGQFPVLVATDVAARGLDVSGISQVINFDVPHSSDDYIHRAGRTGRAGAVGEVITFVSPAEEERFEAIEAALGTKVRRSEIAGFEAGSRPAAPIRGAERTRKTPPARRLRGRRRSRPAAAARV
jgi:ATP-dependent RNA helicase RhlE